MLDLNEIHHWIWDEFGGELSVIATLKQSHCADLSKLPLRHPESLVACIGTVPVLRCLFPYQLLILMFMVR